MFGVAGSMTNEKFLSETRLATESIPGEVVTCNNYWWCGYHVWIIIYLFLESSLSFFTRGLFIYIYIYISWNHLPCGVHRKCFTTFLGGHAKTADILYTSSEKSHCRNLPQHVRQEVSACKSFDLRLWTGWCFLRAKRENWQESLKNLNN